MIRRQPRTIRPDTLLPYTTRFRSKVRRRFGVELGARARERLKAAAAARWGVPVSEVIANDSVLIHQASDRKLRYGDVVTDAAKLTLDAEPPLKTPAEWTFLGKAAPSKLHIPEEIGRAHV